MSDSNSRQHHKGTTRSRTEVALDRWQAELLDLSKANRLLYFKTGRGVLTITQPDTEAVFDGLVQHGRSWTFYAAEPAQPSTAASSDEVLAAVLDADGHSIDEPASSRRPLPANLAPSARPLRSNELLVAGDPLKLQSTLYRLRLRARTALQEQGINVLFVACGILEWTESASSVRIQSPLLLVPVTLERATALDPYKLVPLDEGVVFNPALLRKLETDFKLKLDVPLDEGDLTFEAALAHVREAVAGRRDWSVHAEAHLGLFSFAKYAMYADLAARAQPIQRHPVVRLLSGADDGLPEPVAGLLLADQLDDRLKPTDVFQVLDADASQQEAIVAVKAGANLVIQGPPGTGKSQTITNIIAESLAQGKTVLFVSEKMAALRVVANRLATSGLGEFCLEAHSQGANKAAIIHNLAATMSAGRNVQGTSQQVQLERLERLRQDLNAYVHALHDRQNPLGQSAFQIHGELARRAQFPTVSFELPQIQTLTPQRLTELTRLVQRLVHVGDTLLTAETHPWRDCTLDSFSPAVQATLDTSFRRLEVAARDLAELERALRAAWGLPHESSIQAATWLRDLLLLLEHGPKVPPHWLRLRSVQPLLTTAERYQRLLATYRQQRAAVLERYQEAVFALDLAALAAQIETGGASYVGYLRGTLVGAERAFALHHVARPAVDRAILVLEQLHTVSATFAAQLGLPVPETIGDIRKLQQLAALVLSHPRPLADWLAASRRGVVEDLVAQARQHQETLAASQSALAERFQPELYAVASAELAERFEAGYASWLRIFKPAYYRDIGRIRSLLTAEGELDYIGARDALRLARRVAVAQAWLDERRQELSTTLGHHYAGSRTNWDSVQQSLETVRAISALLDHRPLPAPLERLLLDDQAAHAAFQRDARAFDEVLTRADQALTALSEVLWWPMLPEHPSRPQPAAAPSFEAWQQGHIAATPARALADWLQAWRAAVMPIWQSIDQLQALRTTPALSLAELAQDVQHARAVRQIEADVADAANELHSSYGHLFTGLTTQWDRILVALAWAGRIIDHFGRTPDEGLIEALIRGVSVDADALAQLTASIAEISAGYQSLGGIFSGQSFTIGHASPLEADVADVARWAAEKRASLRLLEEWIDLNQARAAADAVGLTPFVEQLVRERMPREQWLDIFLRQLYTLWLTWRYSQSPELASFRTRRHTDVVAEFRRLDQLHWQHASSRIAERLVQKRPLLTANLPPKSEPSILLKEASKRRRFRPLRKLFADLPNLLPALKPCMLMSPLGVAQFLGESAVLFDVVIFDEASQILPSDAIGAICRGRQMVVVGDQQQLPPTRFFVAESQIVDEDNDEEVPESILDACMAAGVPIKPLLWHYRSRHEDLIAFSNRHFYHHRLITFPSADVHRRAVEFHYIEHGVYDRASTRVNRIEAKWIVHHVIEHVTRRPDQSLGVITFSEAQMVAIQTELDDRKRAQPYLEDLLREDGAEAFFVKNLENVQGDERDVIFFSVGYGPDQAGNMTMNFGPLNRQGGERRLNVAITRARLQVKILASFQPHAIDRSRTQAKGVHLLRSYLEFAAQGPRALLGEVSAEGGAADSPFEEAVADALRARGLQVVPQVGVGAFRVDLAIRDAANDRFLLGIECDGATYHASKTARDRDRLRQQVLEDLGWRIHRIWSTDWLKDPAAEVERVVLALRAAEAQTPPDVPPSPPMLMEAEPPPVVPPLATEAAALQPSHLELPIPAAPIVEPYVAIDLMYQGDQDDFYNTDIADLSELVMFCVDVEGPIHQDRIMRTIATKFCIGRVGNRVQARLQEAIDHACRNRQMERRGPFIWRRTMTIPPVRGADALGQTRPIREVAPEELAAAIQALLRSAFSINKDSLITAVARELGYDRTGTQVAGTLAAIVDELIAVGTVINVGDQLRLAE